MVSKVQVCKKQSTWRVLLGLRMWLRKTADCYNEVGKNLPYPNRLSPYEASYWTQTTKTTPHRIQQIYLTLSSARKMPSKLHYYIFIKTVQNEHCNSWHQPYTSDSFLRKLIICPKWKYFCLKFFFFLASLCQNAKKFYCIIFFGSGIITKISETPLHVNLCIAIFLRIFDEILFTAQWERQQGSEALGTGLNPNFYRQFFVQFRILESLFLLESKWLIFVECFPSANFLNRT